MKPKIVFDVAYWRAVFFDGDPQRNGMVGEVKCWKNAMNC